DGNSICVYPDADLVLHATPATGSDDKIVEVSESVAGTQVTFKEIVAGLNHICQTSAACDPGNPKQCDTQGARVGVEQERYLTGFDDWPALVFDGAGRIGASGANTSSSLTGQASETAQTTEPQELPLRWIQAEAPPALLAEEDV